MMNDNGATMRSTNDYEKAGNFPKEESAQGDPQAKLDQRDQLQALGATLAKQRDEWISARRTTGWDKRIQEDLDQYHARDHSLKFSSHPVKTLAEASTFLSCGVWTLQPRS